MADHEGKKAFPYLWRFILGLALVMLPGMVLRQVWPVWPLTLFPDVPGLANTLGVDRAAGGVTGVAATNSALVTGSATHAGDAPIPVAAVPLAAATNKGATAFEPPFLANADQGLTNFLRKVAEMKNGRRERVRIMHYGDSMLWHENTARRISSNLKKEFGDGGRGIVYLHHGDFGVDLDGHATSGDSFPLNTIPFELFNHIDPKWQPRLGFSGMSWFAASPFAVSRQKMTTTNEPWTRVELLLRANDGQDGLEQKISVSGAGWSNARAFRLATNTKAFSFSIPPSRALEFRFGDPAGKNGASAWIDGLSLERDRGLVYSSIIHKGRHMAWMTAITTNNFREGYRAYRPDLVIMQFGINESASINWKSFEFSEAYYLKQMRELYGRLRAAVPDCDVLILGPYERLKPEDGVFINYEEHDRVRARQRQVAREFGFAYFDSWSFWGGKGQMKRLIKEKLAHTDYAHLTMEGGDRMADGITAEIMGAYGRRIGDKKLAERATSGKLTHGQVTEEDAGGPIMFNSNAYLIFYLIVFAMAAILLRFGLARIVFLTVVSWYFYATWQWWALGLMLFSTFIDYFSAIKIGTIRDRLGLAGRTEAGVPGWNRGLGWLLLSLVSNLGLLFSFKYHDFIATLFNPLLAQGSLPQIPLLDLILPVGISFYTFQTLSYTIDVYRGDIAAEKSFWRFSLFVSFFPQLVAGPIVRATQFLPGLRDRFRHFTPDARICGIAFWLLGTGLVKKCLADWIAMSHVDRVFQMPSMYTASEALLAIYGFGAQIYLDFSSYTGMAIGSAMLLGFNLTENFKEPYKSISISDFWRRWHISLGTWIKDYIYISLGGNRKRVYLNLFITMFLAGLWHGAGVNFVLWGVFHGLFLIVERFFGWHKLEREKISPLAKAMMTFVTFHVVMFGWLLFRSHDWAMFTGMLDALGSGIWVAPNVSPGLLLAISLPFVWHLTSSFWKEGIKTLWLERPALVQGMGAACLFLVATSVRIAEVKSFIYFQF